MLEFPAISLVRYLLLMDYINHLSDVANSRFAAVTEEEILFS